MCVWRCSATDTRISHFTQEGSKLPAQSTASSICKLFLAQRRRFVNSSWHHAGLEGRLQNQATTESPPPHPAEAPDEYSDAEFSSSPASPPVVCSQYRLSQLKEEENGRDEVDDFDGGAPIVDEDVDAASDAGCQRKAADPAPPADPLKLQGASQLHSGPDEEKAELLRKVSRLREIAHLYNDEAEEWFGKYMKYKGHQETRITALLQRHFPLSNIAG